MFSEADLAERRSTVEKLAWLGKTDYDIARTVGVSKTTIAADRRTLGIAPRPPGSRRSTLSPEPRPCEACGELFTPARGKLERGQGRFCSKECMAFDPKRRRLRRFASTLNARRADSLAELRQQVDLLTREEVAIELGVSPSAVDHYARRGYLEPVRVQRVGQQFVLLPSERYCSLQERMASD